MIESATLYDEKDGGREIIALVQRLYNGPVKIDNKVTDHRFVVMFENGQPTRQMANVLRLWLKPPA